MIEFKKVSKSFGDHVILDNIDLFIPGGEITTIIGKSGMGKTVILKHIIGLLQPDSGQILFDGSDIANMPRRQRKQIKSKFGFMFQNVALFDSMTVFDNVALPLREKTALSEAEIKTKVMDKLGELEVDFISNKYPAEISGGMKKRVGLARVLIMNPEIILFDEPTTGLDPIRKNAVHSMIAQIQRQFGFTGIIVSHEIPDIFYLSHKVAMLENGHILIAGTPDNIRNCDIDIVQEFIQGETLIRTKLTGFDAKQVLFERFEEECGCSDDSHIFSIIVFTVHNMEKVQAALGESSCCQLMQELAGLERSFMPATTVLARYQKDTLVALLPECDKTKTMSIIELIQSALKRNKPLLTKEHEPVDYAITAGCTEVSKDLWMLEEAVNKANLSMKAIGAFHTRY